MNDIEIKELKLPASKDVASYPKTWSMWSSGGAEGATSSSWTPPECPIFYFQIKKEGKQTVFLANNIVGCILQISRNVSQCYRICNYAITYIYI